MPVTETLQGLGEWSITLSRDTPQDVLDRLTYFGHLAVHASTDDPRRSQDEALRSARYVGVFRGKEQRGEAHALRGVGMALWLGDEDAKGHVFEDPLVVDGLFQDIIPTILPPSVQPGTIFNVPKSFSQTFQYVSPREVLNFVCSTLECAWRINGDGTVDAGLESDLFVVIPQAAVVRRERAGRDMFLNAFAGTMATEQDVNDFTTRTVLLANGSEGSTVTATADIDPGANPFKDLFGNPVALTRLISESETNPENAPARAALQLARFTEARNAITLSTSDYDLKGDVAVGDYLWAYDPEIDVQDVTNQVTFRGERFYPMKLRLTEMTWAVARGMGVTFRTATGDWIDLTPYLEFESGDSSLVVGGFNRSLVGGDGGTIGSRPIIDTSIPDAPTWTPPFVQSVYQSDRGESRAQVQLTWTRPLNVDGSTILDGDHFEIRYRSATTPIYPSTHAQMAVFTHAQLALGTHRQPITYPAGPWHIVFVPWSDLDALLIDLPTNLPYEAQIRAVDAAKPPNAGDWSAVTLWQTNGDTLPPAPPAPPTVAASRLAVMITHHLGRASGGSFNLDLDLHHLEVHGEYEPLFTPTEDTLLGKVLANSGMITGQIPVVGTVPIESTNPVYFKVIAVDNDGNKSLPSVAVQATALLVDDAHISNLTVSKVTAGTITADWLLGAYIRTGVTGSRVQLSSAGMEAFNSSNVRTVFVDAATGSADFLGVLRTGLSARRVLISDSVGGIGLAGVEFFPSVGASAARIFSMGDMVGGGASLHMESGELTSFVDGSLVRNQIALTSGDVFLGQVTAAGATRGGKLQVGGAHAFLGYQTASIDAFFGIGSSGDLLFKGFMPKGNPIGGLACFWGNYAAAGGGAANFAYGATMTGTITVLATWTDWTGYLGTTVVNVYNATNSGFTVGNGTAARNGHYTVLAIRFP